MPFPAPRGPLLSKDDLKFRDFYSWNAIPPDDPRATGKPDSTELNRREGYEVLYFINRIASFYGHTDKEYGLKIERLIRFFLPGKLRSHQHVWDWLAENWSKYP